MARGTGRTGALGMAPRSGDLIRPLLVLEAARDAGVVRRPRPRPWSATRPTTTRATPARGCAPACCPPSAAIHPGAGRHVAALADALRDEAALSRRWSTRRGRAPRAAAGSTRRRCAPSREPMRRLLVRRLVAEAGLPGDALGAEPVARVLGRSSTAAAPSRCPATGAPSLERGLLRGLRAGRAARPAPRRWRCPAGCRSAPSPSCAREGEAVAPRPDRVAVLATPARSTCARRATATAWRSAAAAGVAVGRLLAGAGVPARLRPLVPVVASGDRVVWVAGHRAADDLVTAGPGPGIVLELERA